MLAAGAGPRLPVAIRVALRDLVRYRARSGAALAAVTFAVFLATVICLVGSERFGNPLSPSGPNLSSSQLVVTAGRSPSPGMMMPLTSAQEASLGRRLNNLAVSLRARSAVLLTTTATLSEAGVPLTQRQQLLRFGVRGHSAVARHLRDQGQPDRSGTDFLTSRPGLAGLPHMQMIWQAGNGGVPDGSQPGNVGGQSCTLSNDCLASPAMQTVSNLPTGYSAPNTVITEYAVRKYHLQTQLTGWLIQAPAPLTATQIQAARRVTLAYQAPLEIASAGPELGQIAAVGTALGIIIALGVLAASVGLIRSETARDLRTLTATGASATTAAGDHRGDRGRNRPARRCTRHGVRRGRQPGLGARQPVWHVRRRAADRRADPAGRASTSRRGRRLAAGRPRAGGHLTAAARLTPAHAGHSSPRPRLDFADDSHPNRQRRVSASLWHRCPGA